MAQFDPNNENVDDVLAKLDKASPSERDRILREERAGKARKSILEPYGIDPEERVDATGRVLYPWEVTGDDMADAHRQPEESEEQRKARELQAEQDEKVAATAASSSPTGGGTDPAGTGVAPAAQAPGPATGGGTTTATAAGGTL